MVCLVAPAVTMSLLASAQTVSAQGLHVGVKAGVASSTVEFQETDVAFDRRTGFLAGVFVTLPVARWLTLQPEALYVTKGGSLAEGAPTDLELDYLELPVLVRVPVARGLFATAGPSFAYRLRARSLTTFAGETEEIDLADEIERWDVGMAAGLGIALGRLDVEARYTHGMRSIDAGADGSPGVKNRTFALSAGFRF